MAVIGIALVEIVLRNAVERGEDHLRLEIELGERRAGRGARARRYRRDRRNRARRPAASAASASPSARRTPCRRPSPSSRRNIADRAARAGCGRSRSPAARRGARRSTACRSASPSRRRSAARPPLPSARASFCALRAGDGLQRPLVALLVPDRIVVAALGGRAARQDDEIEDRPPQPARRLDHAPVGQELLEIAPHRPIVGRLRRAEIDDQHADPAALERPGGSVEAASGPPPPRAPEASCRAR